MHELRRHVPSLQALMAFESAARLGGFSRAAEEIGIGQPVVSRHIQGLEKRLGTLLFERRNNRVRLSAAGAQLYATLSVSFAEMARTLEEVSSRHLPESVVLATHSGFAQQWLLPRLAALTALLEPLEMRLWICDAERELDRGGYDLAIRHGHGAWPETTVEWLFDEEVFPVAAPALLETHPSLARARPLDLLQAPLIHMDEGDRPWMTWSRWLAMQGVEHRLPPPRLVHNNYPLVLQSALAGRGVALAWRQLAQPLVESGALLPVGPTVLRRDCAYFLVWPRSVRRRRLVEIVLNWLRRELALPGNEVSAATAG